MKMFIFNKVFNTYVKGHDLYKDTWTPKIGESLDAQIEPNSPVDKYAMLYKNLEKLWDI